MIVIDSSVLVEVLLRRPLADVIDRRLEQPDLVVCAPHLIDVETAHIIRRLTARREIADSQAQQALTNLAAFRLDRFSHEPLLPRIWDWRHNLTAYDAAYVALAELIDAPLLTRDRRLAQAPGPRARIELV